MDAQVSRQLKQVVRRTRTAQRLHGLSWLWSLTALAMCLAWASPVQLLDGSVMARGLLLTALALTVWLLRPLRFTAQEAQNVARSIENRFPELQQRLLTAIEQKPNPETGHFSWLQNILAAEVRSHSYVHDWRKARPLSGLLLRGTTALCAMAAAGWLTSQLWNSSSNTVADVPVPEIPDSSVSETPFQLSVDPGHAEVERGTSVLILARFDGRLPAEVSLNRTTADGDSSLPMAKALDDPLFGIRLPSVWSDFDYSVQYDGETSEQFHISVYERPRIEQIDATVKFPSYTNLPDEKIEDTWQVAAVEGSTVQLTLRLNKPIADGALFSEHGDEFLLVRTSATEGTDAAASRDTTETPVWHYAARIPVTRSMKLEIGLEDDRGRSNRDGDEFRIDALPNKPPEIKLTFPARDLRVSPVEELQLEASIWDDFGVKSLGLELAVADRPPQTIMLARNATGRELHQLAHLIQLEKEQAAPDQLVSYYFFADDFDAQGRPRRTVSDMFFAEIRHFEEIFREGQPPPAGQQQQQQGQNTRQAEQLADLQKQIVTATWNVIRQETQAEVSSSFQEDVNLLITSQQDGLSQLQKLAERIQDPVSRGHATGIARAMTAAVEQLTTARDKQQADLLNAALSSERTAYQGLLKLRAREHEVTRQQQRSQSSGRSQQNNRSQQQLDQLELDSRKNRYEAERQAQPQEDQQQNQEQLQVLNRLRELARRQGDLNQKLRELELALKTADDLQEQQEIERQLKRLRDEQRELLRDMDELRNRMEQPRNQQQLAQESRKLDETRNRVRQASEALERGQVSQALNQGTRAERELEQLRDDVRQKASGQFGSEMRDLRRLAREIAERQDQIARQLKGDDEETADRRPSLRSRQNRTDLRDEFRDQRKQLEQVMDRMRDVVEKAETAEPLLARQLYETIRQSRADRTDEALEQADVLLQRGLVNEAAQAEDHAHQGIDRMQQGIEQAAESVLGNELETLKRASRELADAREAIAQELRQQTADPRTIDEQQQDRPTQESGNDRPDGGQPAASRPAEPQPSRSGPGQLRSTDSSESTRQPRGESREPASSSPSGQPADQPQQPGTPPSGNSSRDQSAQEQHARSGQQASPKAGMPETQQFPENQASSQENPNGSPSGQQPSGQQPSGQGQASEPQNSSSPAAPNDGQSAGRQNQSASGSRDAQPGSRNTRQRPGLRQPTPTSQQHRGGQQSDSSEHHSQGGPPNPAAPLTGDDFVAWSDQLRNIEELVDDPELRAEVARIREAARNMRVDFKRHSKEPEWPLVRMQILEPLNEIRRQLQEEIARRESPDSLVPIDRDPIPEKYADLVREYYRRIGAGRVLTDGDQQPQ